MYVWRLCPGRVDCLQELPVETQHGWLEKEICGDRAQDTFSVSYGGEGGKGISPSLARVPPSRFLDLISNTIIRIVCVYITTKTLPPQLKSCMNRWLQDSFGSACPITLSSTGLKMLLIYRMTVFSIFEDSLFQDVLINNTHFALKKPGNLTNIEVGSNWNSPNRLMRADTSGPGSSLAGSMDWNVD